MDPDDDGSNDTEGDDTTETNVQVNVLNISKLDRALAKRRCLHDFYDLRTSIDVFQKLIERNETVIDPDVREQSITELNRLFTSLNEYLTYRFSYTNYEDNLQNYFIFVKSLNGIIKNVQESGIDKK